MWSLRLPGPIRRGVIAVAGLTTWFGCVLVGSWDFFDEPPVPDQGFDPSLVGVTYAMSRWPLTIGRALIAGGVLVAAIAWFSSERWHEGARAPRAPTFRIEIALLVAMVVVTVVPIVLVRVVARQ